MTSLKEERTGGSRGNGLHGRCEEMKSDAVFG